MDQHLSIEKTEIQGLYVVNPASYKSDEDLIVETYNSQELLKNSLNMTFVQENQSMSVKGVLRGLHVQKNFPQGKLVRVVRGKMDNRLCEGYGTIVSVISFDCNKNYRFIILRSNYTGIMCDSATICCR